MKKTTINIQSQEIRQLVSNRNFPPVISNTDEDVVEALGNYLESLFPDVDVYRGQENFVSPPKDKFIVLNMIGKTRLSTNRRTYIDTEQQKTQNTLNPMEMTVQVDFYGKNSGERAHIFNTLFHDFNGYDSFPANIKPLYSTDPSQMPLINGEKNFEERWRLEAHIQFNAVVVSATDFFDNAVIQINAPSNFLTEKER